MLPASANVEDWAYLALLNPIDHTEGFTFGPLRPPTPESPPTVVYTLPHPALVVATKRPSVNGRRLMTVRVLVTCLKLFPARDDRPAFVGVEGYKLRADGAPAFRRGRGRDRRVRRVGAFLTGAELRDVTTAAFRPRLAL